MKIYSIIVTIIAVLALAILGYGYYTGLKIKKVLTECNTQNSAYQSEIQTMRNDEQKKTEEILGLAEVLRESSSSFMHAGDVKASSFNTASLDKIDQEIKNLKNAHVQDAVKKKWETFLQTSSLNDYRDFIGTLADVIKDENGASLNKK
jgi:hypothetical protein